VPALLKRLRFAASRSMASIYLGMVEVSDHARHARRRRQLQTHEHGRNGAYDSTKDRRLQPCSILNLPPEPDDLNCRPYDCARTEHSTLT
jgi:hypothetical protein